MDKKLEFDEGDLRIAREFAATIRARHPTLDSAELRYALADLLTLAFERQSSPPSARESARARNPSRPPDVGARMAALAKQAGFRGSGEIEQVRPTSRPPKKKPPV